jgi:hypothetical protein
LIDPPSIDPDVSPLEQLRQAYEVGQSLAATGRSIPVPEITEDMILALTVLGSHEPRASEGQIRQAFEQGRRARKASMPLEYVRTVEELYSRGEIVGAMMAGWHFFTVENVADEMNLQLNLIPGGVYFGLFNMVKGTGIGGGFGKEEFIRMCEYIEMFKQEVLRELEAERS